MSWRRATRADLPLAGAWTLASLCAIATVPLLPWLAALAAPCPLRTLTGIPCLTCGATRAASALAHGHWLQALAFNPLAALGIAGGVMGGVVAPAWVLLSLPLPRVPQGLAPRLALAGIMAANWAWLIAHRG